MTKNIPLFQSISSYFSVLEDVISVLRYSNKDVPALREVGELLAFRKFGLTTATGNAMIIRVPGRLAQLVRALR